MRDVSRDVKDALNKNASPQISKTMLNAQETYKALLASGLIKPPEYNIGSSNTNTPTVQNFAMR